MKPGTLSIAVLILCTQQAFAGAEGSLLSAGLDKTVAEVAIAAGHRIELMSPAAHAELSVFNTRRSLADHDFDTPFNKTIVTMNPTQTSGVVNTLKIHSDGTTVRSAFRLPRSSGEVEQIGKTASDFPVDSRVDATTIYRYYRNSAEQSIRETDTFYVGEVNGKKLRRTFSIFSESGPILSWAKVATDGRGTLPPEVRALDVAIEAAHFKAKTHVELPAYVKGEIVDFRLSANGSRLTAITSEGQEVQFSLKADIAEKKIEASSNVAVRDLPSALAELEAESKVFPARQTAAESVRGLQVEKSGANK